MCTMFRPRSNRYVRIDNEADDAGELLLNRQFEMPERPFPKKEIILGIGMLLLGVALITLGILIHVEQWDNDVPGSTTAYICLGLLVFLPGAYASTIAAGSWLGVQGFSYDMMPHSARDF